MKKYCCDDSTHVLENGQRLNSQTQKHPNKRYQNTFSYTKSCDYSLGKVKCLSDILCIKSLVDQFYLFPVLAATAVIPYGITTPCLTAATAQWKAHQKETDAICKEFPAGRHDE